MCVNVMKTRNVRWRFIVTLWNIWQRNVVYNQRLGVQRVKTLEICMCVVNSTLKFLYRNAKSLDTRSRMTLTTVLIQCYFTRSRMTLTTALIQCYFTRSRMTLTTALIQCYFDYSRSSWYCSLGKSMIKKLQVILDLGPRSRINCDILDKVNMLSVTDRVRQLRLNHVFNIFHGHAPAYLYENFNLNNNLTRGATNFNFFSSKWKYL
jgi:hypothetical protein